jgi:hypothetical protein
VMAQRVLVRAQAQVSEHAWLVQQGAQSYLGCPQASKSY